MELGSTVFNNYKHVNWIHPIVLHSTLPTMVSSQWQVLVWSAPVGVVHVSQYVGVNDLVVWSTVRGATTKRHGLVCLSDLWVIIINFLIFVSGKHDDILSLMMKFYKTMSCISWNIITYNYNLKLIQTTSYNPRMLAIGKGQLSSGFKATETQGGLEGEALWESLWKEKGKTFTRWCIRNIENILDH